MTSSKAQTGLLLATLFADGYSYGRFYPSDADEIDQEEDLSSEFYNDLASYRYPNHWEQASNNSPSKIQVMAGSLDANRFYYSEKLTAQASDGQRFTLSLRRHREQDLIEEQVRNEVDLKFMITPSLYTGVFFEGNSYKKFIDIGAYVGYELDENNYAEAYYVSVDHYYNKKEEAGKGEYTRSPFAIGVRSHWQAMGLELDFEFELNSPVRWRQLEDEITYEYFSRSYGTGLSYKLKDNLSVSLRNKHEDKDESKYWFLRDATYYRKVLSRDVTTSEFKAVYSIASNHYVTVGYLNIFRNAKYTFVTDPDIAPDVVYEETDSPDIHRQENLYYVDYASDINLLDKLNLSSAVYVSDVDIIYTEMDVLDSEQEIKLKIALEYPLGNMGAVILGSNWDIDKLISHFPYTDKPFESWDGGSFGLQMSF